MVAAYWRTNLTVHHIAPLFGVSTSAADRINLWSVRAWFCA